MAQKSQKVAKWPFLRFSKVHFSVTLCGIVARVWEDKVHTQNWTLRMHYGLSTSKNSLGSHIRKYQLFSKSVQKGHFGHFQPFFGALFGYLQHALSYSREKNIIIQHAYGGTGLCFTISPNPRQVSQNLF